jgi:hypothetical protein
MYPGSVTPQTPFSGRRKGEGEKEGRDEGITRGFIAYVCEGSWTGWERGEEGEGVFCFEFLECWHVLFN